MTGSHKSTINTAAPLFLLLWLGFSRGEAIASISNAGVLDNVLARYATAASTWGSTITARASWIFWVLVLISMVWTFGIMALRKADLSEFFAEFVRFTVFTGFFWWLLLNGPMFAMGIMDSLRTIGGMATGTGGALVPSGIVDIGFDIFFKVLDQSSVWSPVDSFVGLLISGVILIIMALIGVNMLLLLVSGWILAYAGVFFLGFGGARWTSDMAINYYKTVLSIAGQLLTMVLLVGIGKSFVDQYYNNMSAGLTLKELGVMMIVAVILLALVNKLPAMIGGLAMGGGTHALGGGFGGGAAVGAAAMAAAAIASGGAAIAASAANAAGGGQAIMSAISKASQNVSGGTDIVSRMVGGLGGGGGQPDGQTGGDSGSGGSPLASVMDGPGSSSGSFSSGGEALASDSGQGGGGGSSFSTTGKVAADTAANLAKGGWDVAKAKAAAGVGATKNRISQTMGGQIAAAIKGQSTAFDGNSLAGNNDRTVDAESEVAAFRDREVQAS
jgi:type IV secretion system protein VirB6/type IV secretion system protein TrbL